MGRMIAFANQKGGVGKTTSAVNIAASLGHLNRKTLLVDLDPQGSATSGTGISKKGLRFSAHDLLIGGCRAEDAILHTDFQNLDVLPANISLSGAEYDLLEGEDAHAHLKHAFASLRGEYDCIILDCPPSLGMLTVNALAASDAVVIPMQCEFYALEGLSQLLQTVQLVKKRHNPRLIVAGVLVTMYQSRLTLSSQVMQELKKHYGDRVFETTISRSVRLSEAPSYGKPVLYYDKSAKGAKEYLRAAEELLART